MAYSNVLFVDDNFWCHVENCDYLREHGVNISEAYSALEALDVIGAVARVSALVTDIDLGAGPDGFDVARYARAAYPRLPVVYISGAQASRYRREGVERSEFVSKPFAPQQIMEALDRAIYLQAA